MPEVILDASALLALLNGEDGAQMVARELPVSAISAVNGPAFVLKTLSTFPSLTRLSFISFPSSSSLIPEDCRHRPAGSAQGGPKAGEGGNHNHASETNHQGDWLISNFKADIQARN